jgi:hypothetical protein
MRLFGLVPPSGLFDIQEMPAHAVVMVASPLWENHRAVVVDGGVSGGTRIAIETERGPGKVLMVPPSRSPLAKLTWTSMTSPTP